jgi:hypothetical protein
MLGNINDLQLEFRASVTRRLAVGHQPPERRVADDSAEIAWQFLPDIEYVSADPGRLGQQLLADADIFRIDLDAGDVRQLIVMSEMPVAEGEDANAGAQIEDLRAVDFDLEIIGQIHRREERARARAVMLRAFVPVFIDEDLVVEAEFRLLQSRLCGPVISRLPFCKLCHLISLSRFVTTRGKRPGLETACHRRGTANTGRPKGRKGAGRAVD